MANCRQIILHGKQWHFEMTCMKRNMAMANDRRGRQRFTISAPLTLLIGDREIPAYTRDLSNRGVYFYLALADIKLIDRDFEFIVELPPEITLSTCCRIRCRATVLRRENTPWDLAGIAAEILDYSIFWDSTATA
jgi:hypothetical protein